MRDCFAPRSLLKGLTDTSLKCDLSRSTLPLLKEMLQPKLQYPGFGAAEEEDLPVMYPRKEENRLVRRAAICMFPLDLFFPSQHPELQLEMEPNK